MEQRPDRIPSMTIRSEEHTSELQSPDQHSFPTRRSSDLAYFYENPRVTADQIVLSGNRIHDNGQLGIAATTLVLATGNTVYRHTNQYSAGIWLNDGAEARQNTVYDNKIGRAHV